MEFPFSGVESKIIMLVLSKISYFQSRRDDVLNVALAKELAAKKDTKGVQEIAAELWNDDPGIATDCLKVLYEVGAINPALIADQVEDFLKLLKSNNNRMVWGAMTALAAIADLKADVIYKRLEDVRSAMESGSVITMDNGVQVLALVAASSPARNKKVFPFLLAHLSTCRPKDVPQHSEKTLPAVTAGNHEEFVTVLKKRMPTLSATQATRVKKVIKTAQAKA
jgi:hypothetical protein